MINRNSIKLFGISFIITALLTMYQSANAVTTANAAKPELRSAVQTSSTKLNLQGETSITKANPKINLTLRDTDVQQVLRMFADKAGLNIVFHNSATGKVTLDLVNVPLNDAFKLVMQVTNLTYYLDGKTMVVASAEQAKSLNMSKQVMATIPVNYIDASTIADFLNKNIFAINSPGLSNAEIVVTNPMENELLVFGTNNDILMAQRIVNKFDIPPRETTFIVNHTTPKEMATMVCSMLLPGTTNNGSKSSSSSEGGSSSSSSSGGSSEGSGGNSTTSIALGESFLACQIANKASTEALSSFNLQNLSISYLPQRGTVNVIGGSERQIQLIKDFIKKNDIKQPQAYLDVSIIELNESGTKELTNFWSLNSKYFSASFDGDGGTKSKEMVIGPYETIFGTLRPDFSPTLTWKIEALMKNSKLRVLANPKIIITNGQESVIDMTSDYVESVDAEIITAGSSGTGSGVQRTYNIASDQGIKISMVPFISPEGYVTLNIKPDYAVEKDTIMADLSGTGIKELAATLLSRRNLDLKNIRIKDGETLIIGGLINEVQDNTVGKVPFLGDIPYIGTLFRSTYKEKEKNELVIMLTPRIIRDTEDVVNRYKNNENL